MFDKYMEDRMPTGFEMLINNFSVGILGMIIAIIWYSVIGPFMTGIVLVQYPEGIDFGEEKAQLVFGIAGIGDEHLDLLAKICEALEDEDVLEKMKTTDDVAWILEQLS